MRIHSFAVDSFRGISGGLEQNRISFDGKNAIFLFGQNNVGKSSFLRAYEAFYSDSVDESKDFPFDGGKDIVMEISLYIDEATEKDAINQGTSNKYDSIKQNYLDEKSILRLRKTWRDSDKKKSFNETFNVQRREWEPKAYGGIGWGNIFKPLMMKPLFINAMPTEQDVQTVVTEILEEVATSKLSKENNEKLENALKTITELQDEMYKKKDIDSYKADVNSRFESLFSGFKIDIDEGVSKAKFTQNKVGKDFNVSFIDKSEHSNSHEQMGHGAVRMAIFLLMLMRDKLRGVEAATKSFLVLFEEPELFLHPVLTKKLRKLVYEVSEETTPFQVLCASHSPQMIDISKDHMSLVRMTKDASDASTKVFQVERQDLKNQEQTTDEQVKQKIFEILRFDPYICEAFYADEVLLVEGDTEAILARGYQQSLDSLKDIFVVNCHSVVNIPFYQKIFAKFDIPYSVICDTDHIRTKDDGTVIENYTGWNNETGVGNVPVFTASVQKTISDLFVEHTSAGLARRFFVFPETFEPCHEKLDGNFQFDNSGDEGKPFKANRYWLQLEEHKMENGYDDVPIIKYFDTILGHQSSGSAGTVSATE